MPDPAPDQPEGKKRVLKKLDLNLSQVKDPAAGAPSPIKQLLNSAVGLKAVTPQAPAAAADADAARAGTEARRPEGKPADVKPSDAPVPEIRPAEFKPGDGAVPEIKPAAPATPAAPGVPPGKAGGRAAPFDEPGFLSSFGDISELKLPQVDGGGPPPAAAAAPAKTPPPVDEIPKMVAERYEVNRVIGRGGMGLVLLARDTRLGRHVAIKRLVFRSHNMKIVQRRFLREAQTIALLGHVNIVNIYDIGQDNEVGYITMEYIAGPPLDPAEERLTPPLPVNLDQYIKTKGPMTPERAEPFLLKLCSAMEYAHKQQIIHRDIKPSNILLTEELEPKLVDFGLARPIEISKTDEITLEGTMLGTPEYSAPEQWGDLKAVGPTADIYALGGVFWFMLSGRIPRFFRESDVPPHLSPILAKALSQKPGDRFPSVREMAAALRTARGKGDSGAERPDAKTGTREGWPCPNCNQTSPDTANYCVHCGASGHHRCGLCGADIKINAQFCPNCGQDVRLAEESAGILLAAKNHANFLEFETASEAIKPLAKNNNAEAKQLVRDWHEIILRRRNLIMELDQSLRVFNVTKAVESAKQLKGLVPDECLSEHPDFEVVVKYSELITNLRKMLVESATRANEEHNLDKFAQSIVALNEIFGEEVCGAVNAQLESILGALDRLLTQAGLAVGMNCYSRAMEVLDAMPPWKGGELGNRRTRMYTTCKEQIELRTKAIDEMENAVQSREYSQALGQLRKLARFRLPPDHSQMTPAKDDSEAHQRLARAEKALIAAIDENIQEWVDHDRWPDVLNAQLILKDGESRAWKELVDRLKRAINREIQVRYNKAAELEHQGHLSRAENEWRHFLLIPAELVPPHLVQEACDFPQRREARDRARTDRRLRNGIMILCVPWAYWIIDLLFCVLRVQKDGAPRPPWLEGMISGYHFPKSLILVIVQAALFALLALFGLTRWMGRIEGRRQHFPASPRLLLLGLLGTLSPLAFALYQPYYDYLYHPDMGVPGILHPALLVLLVWLGFDLARGFHWRFPACFGLTLSWLAVGPLMAFIYPFALRILQTKAPGESLHQFYPWLWPVAALLQTALFVAILTGEHYWYRRRHPLGEAPPLPAEPPEPPAVAAAPETPPEPEAPEPPPAPPAPGDKRP